MLLGSHGHPASTSSISSMAPTSRRRRGRRAWQRRASAASTAEAPLEPGRLGDRTRADGGQKRREADKLERSGRTVKRPRRAPLGYAAPAPPRGGPHAASPARPGARRRSPGVARPRRGAGGARARGREPAARARRRACASGTSGDYAPFSRRGARARRASTSRWRGPTRRTAASSSSSCASAGPSCCAISPRAASTSRCAASPCGRALAGRPLQRAVAESGAVRWCATPALRAASTRSTAPSCGSG